MIVVTSLAPCFSRRDKDGREIGEAYRNACLASWRQIANQIYTVNAAKETLEVRDVKRLSVCRDASEETGRPLPYLQDIVDAALSRDGERILIVNGDIYLRDPGALLAARPGVAVVSKRIDVDDLNSTGKVHFHGYDAFAVHRQDLAGLVCGGIFGAPWYDHYLPMRLLERGVEVKVVHVASHLRHPLNWSWPLWERLGWQFAQTVPGLLPPFWRFRRVFRRAKGPRVLHELSRRTYSYIDGGSGQDTCVTQGRPGSGQAAVE